MTDFTPEYYLKTWRKTVEEGVREDGLIHDVADDIHEYFTSTKMRDWCEIGDDARRIYNMMFADSPDEEVQDESPLDGIWTGAAAQAADGVWATVADALGLNKEILESVMDEWYFLYEDAPPPMTMDEFQKRYKEEEQSWKKDGLL